MDPQNPQQPSQPFTPQVEPPAPTVKSSLWLKILLGVVLLVLIGGVGYFLGTTKSQTAQNENSSITTQPTIVPKNIIPTIADPTANWKTFNDTMLQYSLKYPSDWFATAAVEPTAASDISNFNSTLAPGRSGMEKGQFKLVTVRSKDKSYIQPIPQNQVISEQTITVDSISGKRQAWEGGLGTGITVTVDKGDYRYSISGYYEESESKKYQEIFDQILSTFKFTDQSQTFDTTNWKTYNYPNFTYSFKAPETYILTVNQINDPSIPTPVQSLTLNETNASGGKNDFGILVWNANLETHLRQMTQDNFQQAGTKSVNGKQWTIVNGSKGETQYLLEQTNKTYVIAAQNKILLEQVLSTFKFTN